MEKIQAVPINRNYSWYKKVRHIVNRTVKNDHDMSRKKILRSFKGNSKRFYEFMRSLQMVKAKVNQITKKNGETTSSTSDDKTAAEVLCEILKEVFVTEDGVTDDSKTGASH